LPDEPDPIDPDGDYPVYNKDGSLRRYTKGYAIIELMEAGLLDKYCQPTEKGRQRWGITRKSQ
jgi:hypothetical protein